MTREGRPEAIRKGPRGSTSNTKGVARQAPTTFRNRNQIAKKKRNKRKINKYVKSTPETIASPSAQGPTGQTQPDWRDRRNKNRRTKSTAGVTGRRQKSVSRKKEPPKERQNSRADARNRGSPRRHLGAPAQTLVGPATENTPLRNIAGGKDPPGTTNGADTACAPRCSNPRAIPAPTTQEPPGRPNLPPDPETTADNDMRPPEPQPAKQRASRTRKRLAGKAKERGQPRVKSTACRAPRLTW